MTIKEHAYINYIITYLQCILAEKMTTKKFADYIYKQTKEIHNISLEAIFGDYIVYKDAKRIGVIMNNELYLLANESLKKLLPDVIEQNPFGWAYHRLMLIENTKDTDILKRFIVVTYDDLYLRNDLICDISSLFFSYRNYPDFIAMTYDMNIVFLRFCYQKRLLKINPLDGQNRILYFIYRYADLTDKGLKIFPLLQMKWMKYNDKYDENASKRSTNIKMLEKYYTNILNELYISE